MSDLSSPHDPGTTPPLAQRDEAERSPSRGIAAVGKVFHAKNSAGLVTRGWYSRVADQGRRHVLTLGVDEPEAKRLDRLAREKLRAGRTIAEIKRWLKQQAKPREGAPLHEGTRAGVVPFTPPASGKITLRHVVSLHAASYFEAQPATTTRYRASLLNLVETAVRHRQGLRPLRRTGQRVRLEDYGATLDLPIDILDDTLVADFQAARLAGCARRTPQELSAKRSANTELRQARCAFGADALVHYRRAKLPLPDLSSFLQAPRFRRVLCHPQLPAASTLAALFAGLAALQREDPRLFTVVALALYGGLRRAEVRFALPSWLDSSAGPAIAIKFEQGFCPKNGRERTIPIPPWLFEHLRQPAAGNYLHGADDALRSKLLAEAVGWLRTHGFQAYRKPLQALRGIYTAYLLATEPNPMKIKTRLGHADLSTTFRYYADEPLADRYCAQFEAAVA